MTLKREIKDAYIEKSAPIYVKTHSNAVYVDENETETLTQRLDNVKSSITEHTTQLDNITDKRLTTITPQMFGCVGDGFTDDTKGLQDAINYCIANDSMLSSDGSKKYLISSTINIEGNLNIFEEFSKSYFKNDLSQWVQVRGLFPSNRKRPFHEL